MSRRARGALAAAAILALAALAAVAAGVVPGRLGDRLGLGGDQAGTAPCVPSPDDLRPPSAPVSAGAAGWRSEPPLPSRRDELKAIRRGRDIWLLGGAVPEGDGVGSLADVLAVDPRDGRYRAMAPLPEPLDHVASGAYRGAVLVAGGYSATRSSARAWRFDASSGEWERAPSLPRPSAAPGSAMLGSRLYVVGGTPVSSFAPDILERPPLADAQAYDFRTGRWTTLAPMPTPRHHLALVAHGSQLYAVGGREQGDFSSPAVERYDPRTDRWATLPDMPQGVGGPAAADAGGRILVAGGGDDAERWISPAAWAFQPETERWTRLPDLREPRHGAALAIAHGRGYVFGGSPCPGFGLARTVESISAR